MSRTPPGRRKATPTRDVPGAAYCDATTILTPDVDPGAGDLGREGLDGGDADGAGEGVDAEGEDRPAPATPGAPFDLDASADTIVSAVLAWRSPWTSTRRTRGRPQRVSDDTLRTAIAAANGNMARAARALGIAKDSVTERVRNHPALWPAGLLRGGQVLGRSRVDKREVQAAWRDTGSPRKTADDTGLPRTTVRSWLRREGELPPAAPAVSRTAMGEGTAVESRDVGAECAGDGEAGGATGNESWDGEPG